jgi:hypothetical protein
VADILTVQLRGKMQKVRNGVVKGRKGKKGASSGR